MTPRFVREFFEWRWAGWLALIAGALAFVGLTLLFIPTHFGGAHFDIAERASSPVPTARAPLADPPVAASLLVAPAPLNAGAAPTALAHTVAELPAPANEVATEPSEAPQVVVSEPAYALNIVDRGDRPTRPRLVRAQTQ
ncbi:MAG: hypothetical protein WDO69_31800 [Pseudomonadota bacterium]